MTEETKNTENSSEETNHKSQKSHDSESSSKLSARDERFRAMYNEEKEKTSQLESALNNEKENTKRLDFLEKNWQLMQKKRIESEVKAIAVSEGLEDLDLIGVFKIDNIKIDDNGEIIGAKELVEEMKAKKPNWFEKPKKVSSTSNISIPIDKETNKAFSAWDMSEKDFKHHLNNFR